MNVDAALYRIYESCIIPLASQRNSKKVLLHAVRVTEFAFLLIAVLSFWSIVSLHRQVIRSPGCLPDLLSSNVRLSNNTPPHFIGSDELLAVFIDNSPQINLSQPDYEFSRSLPVLELPRSFRLKHDVAIYNITLTSNCFKPLYAFPLNLLTRPLDAMWRRNSLTDFVVANSIMYALTSSGNLKSFDKGIEDDVWSWQYYDLIGPSDVTSWIAWKLMILTNSIFFFFLVTSTTALTVRVLINSGFFVVSSLTNNDRDDTGHDDDDDDVVSDVDVNRPIIAVPDFFSQYDNAYYANYSIFSSRSLPFIMYLTNNLHRHYGVHFINKSSIPILTALLTELVLVFSFYEASQIAWSMWFVHGFSSSSSSSRVSVLIIVMLGEYFSMVFLRRSTPVLLTSTCFVFSVLHLMVFCLTRFEVHSIISEHLIAATRENQGMTIDDRSQYRDMYNQLPDGMSSSRPLWSLHMPLNAATVTC